MAKTITIDSVSLVDLNLVQTSPGQFTAHAIYALLSNGQVVTTLNQEVTSMLDSPSLTALASAFSVVEAAVFAALP